MKRRLTYMIWVPSMVVLIVVLTAVILNRKWIYDFYRGVTYEPVGEIARIRDDLRLTEKGTFLFNASRPKLSETTEFNNVCRTDRSNETAVLGCYTGDNIYVYNITDSELDGIRELTSAHELLHAAYARLSDDEKSTLASILNQVYSSNEETLEKELATYSAEERREELYVRAGTEIANLPLALEKHYAEYFTDQDLIVDFYNKYISVFRAIEAEMTALKSEIDTISATIDTKTAEYESRLTTLNANITYFNTCAAAVGCFSSESDFRLRRAILLDEQNYLNDLYNEINSLVTEYNNKVELYNADVTRTENLNQKINSVSEINEIK